MPSQKWPMTAAILNFKMAACFHLGLFNRISFCIARSFKISEMVYFSIKTFIYILLCMNIYIFSILKMAAINIHEINFTSQKHYISD